MPCSASWKCSNLLSCLPCCRTSCYVPRENERKARREIANSNERRRMQSINAGFQALRKMLQPRDGDKLSKVFVQYFLADRTIGRAYGTVSRLSVVCRLSVSRL